jgi:hypothetical protein
MARSLVAALAAIFLLGALSTTLRAAPSPPPPTKEQMEKAKAAFLEGKRLIEVDKKYPEGVEKFKEAYRLSRNPVLLYNIGFTYDDLIKDKQLALFYYEKFLKDAPATAPNRDLAAERVKALKQELGADAAAGGGAGTTAPAGDTKPPAGDTKPPAGDTKPPAGDTKPPAGDTKPPAGDTKPSGGTTPPAGDTKPAGGTTPPAGDTKPTGDTKPAGDTTPPAGDTRPPAGDTTPPARPPVTTLEHIPVEEAPPGRPLDITAFVPENARWQVTLFFRGQHEAKFTGTPMRPRYNELVGRIPPAKMAGSSLQYYVEARDLQGKLVGQSGRATSPHLVFIDVSAKPRFYPDLGGDTGDAGAGTGNGSAGGGTGLGGAGEGSRGGGQVDLAPPRNWKKWGSTAAAGGLLTLSITFYLLAAQASSELEAQAIESGQSPCPSPVSPPCRSFSDDQKNLQAKGKRYETLSTATMVLGLAGAGVAGWFWYAEYRDRNQARQGKPRTVALPLIGDGFVGGAAALEF